MRGEGLFLMICGSRERQKVERRRHRIRDRQWTEADRVTERQQKALSGCNMKMQVSRETLFGPSLMENTFISSVLTVLSA